MSEHRQKDYPASLAPQSTPRVIRTRLSIGGVELVASRTQEPVEFNVEPGREYVLTFKAKRRSFTFVVSVPEIPEEARGHLVIPMRLVGIDGLRLGTTREVPPKDGAALGRAWDLLLSPKGEPR